MPAAERWALGRIDSPSMKFFGFNSGITVALAAAVLGAFLPLIGWHLLPQLDFPGQFSFAIFLAANVMLVGIVVLSHFRLMEAVESRFRYAVPLGLLIGLWFGFPALYPLSSPTVPSSDFSPLWWLLGTVFYSAYSGLAPGVLLAFVFLTFAIVIKAAESNKDAA